MLQPIRTIIDGLYSITTCNATIEGAKMGITIPPPEYATVVHRVDKANNIIHPPDTVDYVEAVDETHALENHLEMVRRWEDREPC